MMVDNQDTNFMTNNNSNLYIPTSLSFHGTNTNDDLNFNTNQVSELNMTIDNQITSNIKETNTNIQNNQS